MTTDTPDQETLDGELQSFLKTSDSRWIDLFRESLHSVDVARKHYARKIRARYPVIFHVEQCTPAKGNILETGAGTGTISLHLSQKGYRSTTLEKDHDMIVLSELHGRNARVDMVKRSSSVPTHQGHPAKMDGIRTWMHSRICTI